MKQQFSRGISIKKGIAVERTKRPSISVLRSRKIRTLSSLAYRHCSSRKGEGDGLNNYARIRGLAIERSASK